MCPESQHTETLDAALSRALDYRGDVTLTLSDSSAIVGYVYDRRKALPDKPAVVRIIPADGSARRTIAEADLTAIDFTGRDTASGRSFETWMKKYVERKLAGEAASIESDQLAE
ncbi:MAG: hypothetical protein ACR2GY_07585 [Phycisphaerales bacterium]